MNLISVKYLEREYAKHYYSNEENDNDALLKTDPIFSNALPFTFKAKKESDYKVANSIVLGRFATGSNYLTISTQYDFEFKTDDVCVLFNQAYVIKDIQVDDKMLTQTALTLGMMPSVKITYLNLIQVDKEVLKFK